MPSSTFLRIEYALLVAVGAHFLLDAVPSETLAPHFNSAALAVVASLLLVHHWRKELLGVYIAVALRATPLVVELLGGVHDNALASPWLNRLAIADFVIGTSLALIFPLPDLAVLDGKYQTIGCRTVRYGGVECRVFYPSAVEPSPVPAKQRVTYLHHGKHLAKGIQQFSGVPAWFLNNLENAYLAAIADAPVATPERKEGWPLVIFSHGLAGSLELYSFINQQLASAGNIVVVVNHSDGSASVTRPSDDRVEYYQQITDAVRHNIDGEGFRFRNNQLRQRVQEVRRVLNAISELSANAKQQQDQLWSSVDLQRIHAAGHSFGAATALTATHQDDRFGAAVLLDAWMEPVEKDVIEGLADRAPVLHLGSDPFSVWKENADRVKQHAHGSTHALTRMKRIAGSRHNNFSDLPLFSPLINRIAKSAGSIDATYVLRMIGDLSAAFLAGSYDEAVLKYPEVVDMHDTDNETK